MKDTCEVCKTLFDYGTGCPTCYPYIVAKKILSVIGLVVYFCLWVHAFAANQLIFLIPALIIGGISIVNICKWSLGDLK